MTLTFWYARCLNDSDCYSVRERTKREAVARVAVLGPDLFAPVQRVTVEYRDGFDLMRKFTGEGGLDFSA